MFQMQPFDVLHAHAPGSAGTMDNVPALGRGGVDAGRWMFEMQPLNRMNKNHPGEEQASAETHRRSF